MLGEGTCFNLCVLNQIQEPVAVESFQKHRQADSHPQRNFCELWETLAAMTKDFKADSMLVCHCTHIFQKMHYYSKILTQLPDLSQPHLSYS